MDIHKRIKALNEATVLDSFMYQGGGKKRHQDKTDGYIKY